MPKRPNILHQNSLSSEHLQEDFIDTTAQSYMVYAEKDQSSMRQERDCVGDSYMDTCLLDEIKAEPMDVGEAYMQVPLNGKKTSRRKQSKPIRVSFIDVDALETDLTTVPQTNMQTDGSEVVKENGNRPGQSATTQDHSAINSASKILDQGDRMIGYENCGEAFPTEQDLKHHIASEHVSKPDAEDRSDFPTKYHRLGSEFQQATTLKQEVKEVEDLSNRDTPSKTPYLPPNRENSPSSSNSQDASVDPLSKSSRIFHPDAYCEICDREFCNKYFLKTHKANKHGIYDGSGGFSSSAVGGGNHMELNSRASSSPEQLAAAAMPPLIASKPEPRQSPPKQITTEQQSALQMIMESSSAAAAAAAAASQKPPVAPSDAEDYCEICQKHFCNKYYLKKHKQDVHGITSSEPFLKRQRLMPPESHILSSLSSSITSTAAAASLILPQPQFTTADASGSLANIATVNGMGNIMLLNPFVPPMAILQAQSLIPAHSQPINPTSVHNLTSLAATGHLQSLPLDNISVPSLVPQESALSSLSQSNLTEKSKALGSSDISNTPKISTPSTEPAKGVEQSADVRCDICNKEFYNTFFLCIHKANKHGIHVDDVPKKSKGSSQGGDSDRVSPLTNTDLDKKQKAEAEISSLIAQSHDESSGFEPGEKDRDRQVGADAEDFCTMCNREFASKYSLKIHMINVHGVKPTDFGSAFSSVVPSGNQPSSHSNADSESEKEKAVLATMFGSIVAAKMADRVTCDICQKEVCNKYFLKTHKMKVHGIAPTPEKDGNSNGSSENMAMKPETPIKADNVEKPPEAELLKMGIDPEAYCEVCKKEFCSKYFLRTHKLNIHGIKDKKDKSSSSLLMSKINKKEVSELFSPGRSMISTAQLPSMDDIKPAIQMTSSPMSAVTTSLTSLLTQSPKIDKAPPILPYLPSPQLVASGLKIENLNSAEKRHWKWKEPVNATRVSCDICNKELCNKYFLRTHKLNKHGIIDDSGSPLKIPSMHGSSSSASSTTSEKSEYVSVEEKSTGDQLDGNMGMKLRTIQEDGAQFGKSDSGEKGHSSCLLCSKQFLDERELGLHILTEHKLKPEEQASGSGIMEGSSGLNCGLCGSVFGDTMSLQLHLIHDHQGRVAISETPQKIGTAAFSTISTIGMSLKKRYAKSGKPKLHSCSQCDYKSRWLSNIYSHEDRKHRGVDGPQKQHTCTECSRVFRYNHSLVRHLQEHHGRFLNNNSSEQIEAKDLEGAIQSQNRIRQKNFKCARCGSRFSSRAQCQAHIRLAHRSRREDAMPTDATLPSSGCNLQCSICPFACKSTLALRAHMAIKHQRKLRNIPPTVNHMVNGDEPSKDIEDQENEDIEVSPLPPTIKSTATPSAEDMQEFIMQPFTIKDMSPEKMLVTSLVRLPVLQKITEPMNITISLKPTED